MATLGFKIGAASGGGATAAAAIGGGLYLGKDSSSENITTEEPSVDKESKEENSKQKEKPELKKGKRTWRKSTSKTPKWVAVKNTLETPVVTKTTYSKQFEKRYSLFLPNTLIDESSDSTTKDDQLAWWENKYELLLQDKENSTLDTKFQEVTQPYHSEDNKALNQVCKSIYSTDESETLTFTFNYSTADEIPIKESERKISDLEKNFWKYCSSLMVKPWNMVESKEASTDGGHISYSGTAGYILAATKEGINDKFWEIKNEWFLNLLKAGKVDEKFKKYAEDKGTQVKDGESISLRKVCATTTRINLMSDALTKEELVQYCAFSERSFNKTY